MQWIECPMVATRVEAVLVGRARPFGPNGEPSAVRKRPVSGLVAVGPEGIEGDEQAYHGHGGLEKAVLHYAAEHYDTWRRRFDSFSLEPGGLGENITTHGMTEENVCLGDRYRLGESVLLEVSQPRQPCWKLGHSAGIREIPRLIQDTGTTGWFYRVVVPGDIEARTDIELVARPYPEWPLSRLLEGFYLTPQSEEFLREALTVESLGREWRSAMESRLENGKVESWEGRLYGPFLKR